MGGDEGDPEREDCFCLRGFKEGIAEGYHQIESNDGEVGDQEEGQEPSRYRPEEESQEKEAGQQVGDAAGV